MAGQNLSPIPHRKTRLIIWAALSLLAIVGTTPWHQKAVFILFVGLVTGTYRRFRVSPGALKQRWTVAYYDLPPKQFKLKRYTRIEVKYAKQTTIGEILLFGGVAFIFGWVLDTFFPWLGGTYQIWLVRGTDEQVLAWQGNSQTHYEQNLEILKSSTGLEVVVR